MTGAIAGLEGIAVPSAEALERICYLVGPARGGTSVVHLSMAAHPRALVLPGVSHFADLIWPERRHVSRRAFQILFNSPQYFHRGEILDALPQLQSDALRKHFVRVMCQGTMREIYQLYPLFLALTPQNDKRDIVCWHDKNNNWRTVAPVHRHFPQARFIFLTRDPRAVVLSQGRRAVKKAGASDTSPGPDEVVEAALYWRLMMGKFLSYRQRHPDKAILVKFEDFLLDPARTLNQIFEFTTGETLSKAELDPIIAGMGGGATNDQNEVYQGISTAPLERWRSDLGQSDQKLVAQTVGRLAGRIGYDVGSADGGVFAALNTMRDGSRRTRAAAKFLYARWAEQLA